MFLLKAQNYIKAQNVEQATFSFLDVFYAHKNTVFFALHAKKQKKAHKKHKNAYRWTGNFLRLMFFKRIKRCLLFFVCLYAFLCFLCVWNLFVKK